MIDAVLVRWQGQPAWHFAPSTLHATTACEKRIPISADATEHQQIDILRITSFRGLCKKCFHEMCIEHQITPLWDIYYKYIVDDQSKDGARS